MQLPQVGVKSDSALHPQFHPSMSQRELPVPIYVTRGEVQRLDNAHALHGELGGSRAGGDRGCSTRVLPQCMPGLS